MLPQLRLATTADAPAIQAIYAPIVQTTIISFELSPPSIEETQHRIQTTLIQYPWLVCADAAEIWGYAYAGAHRTRLAYQWAVDVSVYVHLRRQRRGIGRALYAALLPMLRLQGYYSAYTGIALPNSASVRLHEAMGFTPVGVYQSVGYKLGAWRDVGWWQYDLSPRQPDPTPPQPITAVSETTAWQAILATGAVNFESLHD